MNQAYNSAVMRVILLSVVVLALASSVTWGLEWRQIEGEHPSRRRTVSAELAWPCREVPWSGDAITKWYSFSTNSVRLLKLNRVPAKFRSSGSDWRIYSATEPPMSPRSYLQSRDFTLPFSSSSLSLSDQVHFVLVLLQCRVIRHSLKESPPLLWIQERYCMDSGSRQAAAVASRTCTVSIS